MRYVDRVWVVRARIVYDVRSRTRGVRAQVAMYGMYCKLPREKDCEMETDEKK